MHFSFGGRAERTTPRAPLVGCNGHAKGPESGVNCTPTCVVETGGGVGRVLELKNGRGWRSRVRRAARQQRRWGLRRRTTANVREDGFDLVVGQALDQVDEDGLVDSPRFRSSASREALERLIAGEGLRASETRIFVANAFRDGAIPTTGTAITTILAPVSRFCADNDHAVKKQRVLDLLTDYFDRYFGLG